MNIPSFRFADYHRTIVGFHGTSAAIADQLVDGAPFQASTNADDWLGTGIYFWEYAPRQAWWWARRIKKLKSPAVVGAMIRLGHCFDLLDPENVRLLRAFHDDTIVEWEAAGMPMPANGNHHKNLDCAIYRRKHRLDTCRAVYVPTRSSKRVWKRSWIYEEAHIQICVRNPASVLAVWHVQQDGRYGKER